MQLFRDFPMSVLCKKCTESVLDEAFRKSCTTRIIPELHSGAESCWELLKIDPMHRISSNGTVGTYPFMNHDSTVHRNFQNLKNKQTHKSCRPNAAAQLKSCALDFHLDTFFGNWLRIFLNSNRLPDDASWRD